MSSEDPAFDCDTGRRWGLPPQIIEQLASHEHALRAGANAGLADPSAGTRRFLEKPALVRVRRDQATLSGAERDALNRALAAMVAEGTYEPLARLRNDLSHNMTGRQGVVGLHRFLPWHRRYLWELESNLQRIDCRLRPNDLPLALPYWNWLDPLPAWLTDFSPPGRSSFAQAPAASPLKPTHEDIRSILHGFGRQLPGAGVSVFVRFSYALEGWGCRPDGTALPGNNQVQAWLESVLGQPADRPLHPVFWLHLAQVDRLWSLWQGEHPGSGPALAGTDRVLDPWLQTADEMLRPSSIGYAYDE
jgi:tyrosinase